MRAARARWLGISSVVLVSGFLVTTGQPSQAATGWHTFPASSSASTPVPDGGASCGSDGAPVDRTFAVSGMPTSPLYGIRLTGVGLTSNHVGDLRVVIVAPNGTTRTTVFARTGATTSNDLGSAAKLSGSYNFSDFVTGPDWWSAAATAGSQSIPDGTYHATTAGGSGSGGQLSLMATAFFGLSNLNGTWTLRVTDTCQGGGTSSVQGAALELRVDSEACVSEGAAVGPANATLQADEEAAGAAQGAADTAADRAAAARTHDRRAHAALTKARKALARARHGHRQAAIRKATKAVARARSRARAADQALDQANAAATSGDQALATAQSHEAAAAAAYSAAQAALTACQDQ